MWRNCCTTATTTIAAKPKKKKEKNKLQTVSENIHKYIYLLIREKKILVFIFFFGKKGNIWLNNGNSKRKKNCLTNLVMLKIWQDKKFHFKKHYLTVPITVCYSTKVIELWFVLILAGLKTVIRSSNILTGF